MKFYSTSSSAISTVRRAGYYPSAIVARRLAVRICYVLDLENFVDPVAAGFSHGLPNDQTQLAGDVGVDRWGFRGLLYNLTPTQYEIVLRFSGWWGADEEEQDFERRKAFVVVNLNTGMSLVINSSR